MADWTPEQGDLVEVITPTWAPAHGQGDPPDAMTVTANGDTYKFEWGMTLKVSESTDSENKVGNLDYSGDYPLVRDSFVKENIDMFNLVEKATTTE